MILFQVKLLTTQKKKGQLPMFHPDSNEHLNKNHEYVSFTIAFRIFFKLKELNRQNVRSDITEISFFIMVQKT